MLYRAFRRVTSYIQNDAISDAANFSYSFQRSIATRPMAIAGNTKVGPLPTSIRGESHVQRRSTPATQEHPRRRHPPPGARLRTLTPRARVRWPGLERSPCPTDEGRSPRRNLLGRCHPPGGWGRASRAIRRAGRCRPLRNTRRSRGIGNALRPLQPPRGGARRNSPVVQSQQPHPGRTNLGDLRPLAARVGHQSLTNPHRRLLPAGLMKPFRIRRLSSLATPMAPNPWYREEFHGSAPADSTRRFVVSTSRSGSLARPWRQEERSRRSGWRRVDGFEGTFAAGSPQSRLWAVWCAAGQRRKSYRTHCPTAVR